MGAKTRQIAHTLFTYYLKKGIMKEKIHLKTPPYSDLYIEAEHGILSISQIKYTSVEKIHLSIKQAEELLKVLPKLIKGLEKCKFQKK